MTMMMRRMRCIAAPAAIAALAITAACVPQDVEPTSATEDREIVAAQAEDFAIFVPGSGGCVDVANYSTANGGPIHQWSCHYDANQLWRFAAVGAPGESVYRITSRWSGLALDVTDVSTASGAPIQQWGYGGGANQKFRVIRVGDKFQLQATHSGLCVSVTNTGTPADTGLGTLFRQYACDRSDWHQLFQFNRRGTLTNKALLVLIQNGGYPNGLPFDPGFDLPVGLTFGCGGWRVDLPFDSTIADAIAYVVAHGGLPPFNVCWDPRNWWIQTRTQHRSAGEWLRQVTNFAAESIGKATIETSGAPGRYNNKIIYLQDGDLQVPRIRQELQALAASYLVDIHVLAHGNETSFGLNSEVKAADLRDLRTIVGLTIRSVFQQNCNGSGLNAAWLDGGAQAVTGTWKINSMPVAYGPFIRRWAAGETFANAVQHSYDDVAPMYGLAYRFVDTYDESADQGKGKARSSAEYSVTGTLSPDDELSGSVQIIQGASSVTL